MDTVDPTVYFSCTPTRPILIRLSKAEPSAPVADERVTWTKPIMMTGTRRWSARDLLLSEAMCSEPLIETQL